MLTLNIGEMCRDQAIGRLHSIKWKQSDLMVQVELLFVMLVVPLQTAKQYLTLVLVEWVSRIADLFKRQTNLEINCFYYTGGPTKIIDPIATKLGGVYDESLNDYVVDCDDVTLGTLEYTFGEYKVSLAPEDYLGLTPNGVSNHHGQMSNISEIFYINCKSFS